MPKVAVMATAADAHRAKMSGMGPPWHVGMHQYRWEHIGVHGYTEGRGQGTSKGV